MIGTSLSHYRVTARIGAGGMGEVYRAEDTSLGREVAIKVLEPTPVSRVDKDTIVNGQPASPPRQQERDSLLAQ